MKKNELKGKKKKEFDVISKYLNQNHEDRIYDIYIHESPDFIIKDKLNNHFIGCELTEFYNDKLNNKHSVKKQVHNYRDKIGIELTEYINKRFENFNFWFLIEIDPTFVDYTFELIKLNIENLVTKNLKRTQKPITQFLKGIQINDNKDLYSTFTFVTNDYFSSISNKVNNNEINNIINKKTLLQSKWKEKNILNEKWLIIQIGLLPEHFMLEIENIDIDLNYYSNNWNKIDLYCPYTNRIKRLLN